MPLATLDQKPALVLVDLQKGLRAVPGVPYTLDEVIARAAELATAFRAHQLPVVLVNSTGQAPGRTERRRPAGSAAAPPADFAELVDELDVQPSDILITKETWGAFHNTPLHRRLQDLGVTQVVVGGIATSLGAESTARAAYEHGYNVITVTDLVTDTDPAVHANSVEKIAPKLGERATTSEVLDLLKG